MRERELSSSFSLSPFFFFFFFGCFLFFGLFFFGGVGGDLVFWASLVVLLS